MLRIAPQDDVQCMRLRDCDCSRNPHQYLRVRPISLRAFGVAGMMVDADLANGRDVEAAIGRLLASPATAYIHAHYARPGCYAARIDRA